ncbi:MAG: 30S ribosomal protein S27ae [Candidatus Micrarchaeia archaeon]
MGKKKKIKKSKGPKPYVKGKSCPKCGSGVGLARHKDRLSCGKCGYMEVSKTQE